ncbi:hypothetical protein GMA19_01213 [Paenibacillus polymyxa E681]|nr:hypothetical protein GE561_01213 [Paenibacillus polymyxa E681]QNV60897.1 hypothetical protein GMA19_01213 [Paenibacillus polymyxa E681]
MKLTAKAMNDYGLSDWKLLESSGSAIERS